MEKVVEAVGEKQLLEAAADEALPVVQNLLLLSLSQMLLVGEIIDLF